VVLSSKKRRIFSWREYSVSGMVTEVFNGPAIKTDFKTASPSRFVIRHFRIQIVPARA
jgi:hypothetical protein